MDGVMLPATVVLEGGSPLTVQIQVTEQAATSGAAEDPERDVGILDRVFSFDDVTDSVGAISRAITRALASAAPDEAEVEFGIAVGVEAGKLTSLLVKGEGEATLKVRLLWKKTETSKG